MKEETSVINEEVRDINGIGKQEGRRFIGKAAITITSLALTGCIAGLGALTYFQYESNQGRKELNQTIEGIDRTYEDLHHGLEDLHHGLEELSTYNANLLQSFKDLNQDLNQANKELRQGIEDFDKATNGAYK